MRQVRLNDLKAGDKVYIREDLEEFCDYGGCVYIKARQMRKILQG